MDPSRPSTSERTPLVGAPPTPSYVFTSTSARFRRERLRKLQCCICITMLLTFTLALVITVSYNIEHPYNIDTNDSTGNLTDGTLSMVTLLSLSWPRPDKLPSNWTNDEPSIDELNAAEEAGATALLKREKFEEAAAAAGYQGGGSLRPGSAAHRAQKAMAGMPPAAPLAMAGFAKDHATKYLVKNKSTKGNWCIGEGPKINATWSLPECKEKQPMKRERCQISRYRTINGTCNSLSHPDEWGVAFQPFRRVLPQDYADGVSAPREGSNGTVLPSARQISLQVHRPMYRADPDFSVVLAVWGQFLDHDITATALSQGANGSSISCCMAYETPGLVPHPECFPVPLGPGDPNYHKYNISCMEFVRSAPAPSCYFGPREQLNQATSFIDASTIYGPYEDLANSLRTFDDGEMVMMMTADGRELLPASKDPNDGCNEQALNKEGKYCFVSGDSRANENLHLTTMHLLWARQHNRLARKLKGLNPQWKDQRLYEESRRIVGAQMQHITYNEFLPILFGNELMEKLELSSKKNGFYKGYNASLDPNIANHFASAAFRFAHTLLPTLMKVSSNTNTSEYQHLHKMLFNPYSLYVEGGVDSAIRGAMQTDMQRADPYFTAELTNNLFKRDAPLQKETTAGTESRTIESRTTCGLDLVSLNIQRGRDHGLPAYPAWREHCGFSRPKSFRDLRGILDAASLERISSIYKSVDDVDLYTAALSEVPLEGRILGATMTCLLADQFVRLKRADRFWYETDEEPQAFTREQLDEIRKTTLAGIICENGDSLEMAQVYVMRSAGPDNPLVRCSSIADTSLRPWTETLSKILLSSSNQMSGITVIKGGE